MGTANQQRDRQTIVTLNAKTILNHILGAKLSDEPFDRMEGRFLNRALVLHEEQQDWCPLFDQLAMCLEAHHIKYPGTDPRDRFKPWFLYVDFSDFDRNFERRDEFVETSYGRAMEQLIEHGFSVRNVDDGGKVWHYTVFDKSSSNSRKSVISFLADVGFSEEGNEVSIYDQLNQRLCLDIDFKRLDRARPGTVSWNKYFAYRALYLTTAKPVPLSVDGISLNKETVLVLDAKNNLKATSSSMKSYDVICASAEGDAEANIKFTTDVKPLDLVPFDGEGLIAPDYAQRVRNAIYPDFADVEKGEGGTDKQPSSFQVRMPFAKGVLHEVDFHAFLIDALELSDVDYPDLKIEDAFGISRRLADVKIILTTDMLKCHRWLKEWLDLEWDDMSDACKKEYSAKGERDPMAYYFAQLHKLDYTLYVRSQRRRMGATHEITLNAQYLSTLCMCPDEFDGFAQRRFKAIGDMLFDFRKAREFAYDIDPVDWPAFGLAAEDGSDDLQAFAKPEYVEDEPARMPSSQEAEMRTIACALKEDERFIYDAHIHSQILSNINSELVNLAAGKLTVKGTLRMLSDDLLSFLCQLAECVAHQPEGRLLPTSRLEGSIKPERLREDSLYLPGYGESINETGWLTVLRNPHLSRSEQCILHRYDPKKGKGYYEKYLSHLYDVVMVSRESPAPMILGGADFDGDTVHIYDDAQVADAVLMGAYATPGAADDEHIKAVRAGVHHGAKARLPERRYPIAYLSFDSKSAPSAIEGHITFDQLLQSFRSNVGILSNSALRLSTVLYGLKEAKVPEDSDGYVIPPDEDVCARYTLAVGMDIDSVKTGVTFNMGNLRITGDAQKPGTFLEIFGEENRKLLPKGLGIIHFRKEHASVLKRNGVRAPVWNYGDMKEKQGTLQLTLPIAAPKKKGKKTESFKLVTVGLDRSTELSVNSELKDAFISNVQRLPWHLAQEARRIQGKAEALSPSDGFLGARDEHREDQTPLALRAQWVEFLDESLDEEDLLKVGRLVRAHHEAMWRWNGWKRRIAAAKNNDSFGRARRIAQEYPVAAFSRDEVESILARAVGDLVDYFAHEGQGFSSEVLKKFQRTGFAEWALCSARDRKKRLQRFLSGMEFSDDFYALIEDDGLVSGFMIPYYLIKAAQAADAEQSDISGLPTNGKTAGATASDSDDCFVTFDEGLLDKLLSIISENHERGISQVDTEDQMLLALTERIEKDCASPDRLLDYLCCLRYGSKGKRPSQKWQGCFRNDRYHERRLFWQLIPLEQLKALLASKEEWEVALTEEERAQHAKGASHVG